MAPVATKALPVISTPQQLELWKSTAAWNATGTLQESYKRVRARNVPLLIIEMRKWGWGASMAIDKVAKLEENSQDKYLKRNHDTYDRLWDDYLDMHDPKAEGDYNRRFDGVCLKQTTMLYREVQTAMQAGEFKYKLEYPSKGPIFGFFGPLDSDRRALRFILVRRWSVLLNLFRHLLPAEGYDPDEVEL